MLMAEMIDEIARLSEEMKRLGLYYEEELRILRGERDKLREENARLKAQRDVFDEQASGLFNGRLRGMAEKKALAKRVEELEGMVAAVGAGNMTEPLWAECVSIAERRAGRAK